ncbi:hypothetical protein GMORB2_1799 [Geosmithia morbida]|uniref:Zn(2)-C6 fungal-type domain-containing protein n=1 Tax=Geosmithia morbida TaxID=1094350 RepID=A0A9P4YRV2_9HYPO|nr:uncharacterized protein GMORB2_1799 [Geosmithia morbida]KAF4121392.1 hypothetical protein GMORB2_1799 [Geosmithia morbida]
MNQQPSLEKAKKHPGPRSKTKGLNRSRAGCLTCKQKHVKCDETRPTCRKCAQKGWTCGGYSSGVKWSYKHQHTFVGVRPSANTSSRAATEEAVEREPSQALSDDGTSSLQPFIFDNVFSPSSLPMPLNGVENGDGNGVIEEVGYQTCVIDDPVLLSWPEDDDLVPILDNTPEQPCFPQNQSDTSSTITTLDHDYTNNMFDILTVRIPPMPSSSVTGPEATLKLINNWFDMVCPAWSGFDSDVNMNRRLAYDFWQSSSTVFHSLQKAVDAEVLGEAGTDITLHPWTGISSTTSRLFARSMRLCRTYRRRITNPTGRAISLSTAMHEIEEAQKLEERLLELNFSPPTSQVNTDTGDGKTPWFHLARIAESYQLASLLLLYVTFPDLVSIRLPHESVLVGEDDVPWDKWIVPLTLRLISVLEQIPPDSGSRVMQPLLYICASTGLRYNLPSPPSDLSPGENTIHRPRSTEQRSWTRISDRGILDYVGQIHAGDDDEISEPPAISKTAVDIGSARNFIMYRLSVLESTLQPKPIVVAQNLVKAIWDAYDSEPTTSASVHWLDVMKKGDLISLFG